MREAPRGREAVKQALCDAAAELFASRGAHNISVRDIAEAAGVNHGLVHRHFGSKDNLRRAVFDHLSDAIAAEVGDGADTAKALNSPQLERYLRMLARALLDGEAVDALQSRHPLVEAWCAQLTRGQADGHVRDDVDPRLLAALSISAALGWLMFSPFVVRGVGLAKRKRGKGGGELPRRLFDAWLTLTAPR